MITFLAEILDPSGTKLTNIETVLSLTAARSFNSVGSASLVIPDRYDRSIFTYNTRMRLWRRGHQGTASLFGDTLWFARRIVHDHSAAAYTIEFEDAFALLNSSIVAYSSKTPYADKTLEEFGLITPNDSLRIDNMMRAYVRENLSSLALDTTRDNPLIVVEEDRNLAPYGEKTAAWQRIGDVLSDLARMSAENGLELFYDFVTQTDGTFQFKVWDKVRGVDRGAGSFSVLTLSDQLNQLDDIQVVDDYTNLGTYVYVLGYDSGPSQIVVEQSNDEFIRSDPFGRVEFSVSTPDVDVESVLENTGQAALQGRRPRHTVSARVVDGSGILYGRDYAYGDRVMIHVGDRKYSCHVNAVRTTWAEGVEDLEVRLTGQEEDASSRVIEDGISNQAPVVFAGADQEMGINQTANLNGTVTDDGLPNPPAAVTTLWTKVSGPGTVTFGNDTDVDTTATFDAEGTYVLRLEASDSALSSFDEMEIVINVPAPPPTSPPDFGLVEGQGSVAGIGLDGNIYRTSDFQTVSGSGGPTWDQVDTGITEVIYSFVVDPFSPGYIEGAGTIDGWVATEDAIYRIDDLFGAVNATAVHTFATSAVAADFQWRTIQASFGSFFPALSDNPWLTCVSYYGDTPGHEGTWATFSVDAGVTWSAEVQVSEFYDVHLATRFNPIGVYTSPKTPGLAYTAAYIDTIDESQGPLIATWPEGGSITIVGEQVMAAYSVFAEESESTPGTAEDTGDLIIAPPANTVRMVAVGEWSCTNVRSGLSSTSANLTILVGASGVTRVTDLAFEDPPGTSGPGGTTGGTFTCEWTWSNPGDWPVNKTSIISSPPGSPSAVGARFRLTALANSGGAPTSIGIDLAIRVLEIELDGGTIINFANEAQGFVSTDWGATWAETAFIEPGYAQAGSIHLPWPTNDDEDLAYYGHFDNVSVANREFRLIQGVGGTPTDISPSDGTRSYGVNKYGFAIRTLDSDRQYLLLSGIGNDTSDDPADDMHAVYISNDFGAIWTQVVAPTADSAAPAGRPIYEAAFSPSDPDTFFVWGAQNYISYTASGVAGIDSRAGNLSSFGSVFFIGIAGGPTP